MSFKYLEKLVKYVKEVYKIEKGIIKLSDKRRKLIHIVGQVIICSP